MREPSCQSARERLLADSTKARNRPRRPTTRRQQQALSPVARQRSRNQAFRSIWSVGWPSNGIHRVVRPEVRTPRSKMGAENLHRNAPARLRMKSWLLARSGFRHRLANARTVSTANRAMEYVRQHQRAEGEKKDRRGDVDRQGRSSPPPIPPSRVADAKIAQPSARVSSIIGRRAQKSVLAASFQRAITQCPKDHWPRNAGKKSWLPVQAGAE